MGDWVAADTFPHQSSEFFSFLNEMPTPFQPTPGTSSYGHQTHFFSGSVQMQDQQAGIPTPQSVSAQNSVAFFGHGTYMTTPSQQMQVLHQSYGPNFPQFHHHSTQPTGRIEYGQNPAFITPDRLALSNKATFERVGGHFDEIEDQ